MITAMEARKRVQELEEKHRTEELQHVNELATEKDMDERQHVESKILEAVEDGKNGCWACIWISKNTEEWLKLHFFSVKRINDPRVATDVFISW